MSYFQARSDLNFMLEFKKVALELWRIEGEAVEKYSNPDAVSSRHLSPIERQQIVQSKANRIEGYHQARERVVKGILRANRIASKLSVPVELECFPMPVLAGSAPVIKLSCFDAVIRDISYGGVNRQVVYDALNQTIGECEAHVTDEFRHLINPLYWIKELLVFIIRIPFILVEASGFDISKVEDHLLAKVFKLIEIGAIIYILVRLGLTKDQLQQALLTLFK